MSKKLLIVFSIIILVIALVGGGIWAVIKGPPLLQDPSEEAEYTVEPPSVEILREGKYEIWVDSDETYMDPDYLDITVKDQEYNKTIPIKFTETDVTLGKEQYVKYGEITIPDTGLYNITSSDSTVIYITEPLGIEDSFMELCGGCCMSCGLFLVGAVLLIVGIVLYRREKKK